MDFGTKLLLYNAKWWSMFGNVSHVHTRLHACPHTCMHFHRFDSNGAFIAFEGIKNWCILLKLRRWACEVLSGRQHKPHSPSLSGFCMTSCIGRLSYRAVETDAVPPFAPLVRARLMQRRSKCRIFLPKKLSLPRRAPTEGETRSVKDFFRWLAGAIRVRYPYNGGPQNFFWPS